MKPCMVEFQAFGPYAGHELVDFEKLAAKGLFLNLRQNRNRKNNDTGCHYLCVVRKEQWARQG